MSGDPNLVDVLTAWLHEPPANADVAELDRIFAAPFLTQLLAAVPGDGDLVVRQDGTMTRAVPQYGEPHRFTPDGSTPPCCDICGEYEHDCLGRSIPEGES